MRILAPLTDQSAPSFPGHKIHLERGSHMASPTRSRQLGQCRQAFLGPIDKDRVLKEGSLTVANSHTITIKRAPPDPPRSPCSSVCPGPYARSTKFLKVGGANLGLWSCKSTAVTVPSAQGQFYQPGRVPWLSVVFRCFPGLQGWVGT